MPGPDPARYGDAIADVYDDWYADVSDVEGTVETVLHLAGGGPVLELGVGTGRIALRLAATGADVHGVDASAAMLERLRAKPGGSDLRVQLADFSRELPEVDGGYAVVVAAFNTVLNLTEPGSLERCLDLVTDALSPGGALVVEAFVPADHTPSSGVDVRRVTDAEVVLSVFRRDEHDGAVRGSLVSLSNDGVRLRPWAIRPVSPDELDSLAAAAGLRLERRDGGWRGEPFDGDSDRHVSVYRRDSSTVRGQ